MKAYPLILASAAIGAGLYSYHVVSQQPQPQVIHGVLCKVTDGDTLHVDENGITYRVRLAHIDAPEHDQPGKGDAEAFLLGFLERPVIVEVDKQDRYGRLVGVVYEEGRVSLNKQLVQGGMALWYEQYSDDLTYAAAELHARRKGLGIFGDDVPDVLPWEWRRKR